MNIFEIFEDKKRKQRRVTEDSNMPVAVDSTSPIHGGMEEDLDDSPVAGAITRRILMQRPDLLKQYGPKLVGAAVDNVADYVGDVEEIGSSDVSAWVAQVERMLKENPPEAFSEGLLDEFAPSADRDDNNDDNQVPNDLHRFANLWWNAADPETQEYIADQLATGGWSIRQVDYDHVQLKHRKGQEYIISDDTFDPDLVEGSQDFNRVEPYAVCLAGKPVKRFDYYEQARKFHDNWKQKLYREGNKAKADTITLMPLNLDEGFFGDIKQSFATGMADKLKKAIPAQYHKHYDFDSVKSPGDTKAMVARARAAGHLKESGVAEGVPVISSGVDPKIQFLQPTIQFAEKMGYKATLNPQGRVVAKLVNKQLGHIVHIGLMQPSGKGFEVSMADNLDKQTNAWSAKELAQDFKGWYAQAVKDQDFNNGYNEKPQLEQQGVAEGQFSIADAPDANTKILFLKTINGNEYRLVKQGNVYKIYVNRSRKTKQQFPSFDLAKKALQQLLLNAVHTDEQGVAEGDDLTHAGQDVMVWTGPPTNNPSTDDKKYWIRGKLDSTEMHNGSMRANVMTAKGMYNPELSRVFNADMSEAYTPSPAKPFRNPRGFNKQGTGVGNKLADLNRAELANVKPSTGIPVPAKDFIKGVLKDLKKVNVKEQGVAEASYINGQVEDPESLRWKQTSMSYEQAVSKFGKNNVKQDGKNRLGQKIVMVLVPLGEQGVAEGLGDLKSELAAVYSELAPKIKRHRDSFGAGQLYDALEAVADKHGAGKQLDIMMRSARNSAHMEYDTNPGGFENWFWFLPFATDDEQGVAEGGSKGDYKLELIDQEEMPDPEDWSTMIVYYFDVYKDGKWIGRANGDDYFGDLYVNINGKETKLDGQRDENHPLVKQFWTVRTGLDEGQTDYSERRQRERDVDAGKPVAKQRQSKMTDYQKRRAQQKREMELGEAIESRLAEMKKAGYDIL